jgi:putative phosphoribosyl transferase
MLFREEDEDEEMLPFQDRADAGRILASKLSAYSGRQDVVVVGLARGGVSVAFEVARSLHAPLDVFVVRKLGTPWNRELAMGAIATGGVRVLDLSMVKDLRLSDEDIRRVADTELQELRRREQIYGNHHPPVPMAGKTVILVDDGIATGSSILAAIAALRRQQAARVLVATPVIAVSSYNAARMEADEVVCVTEPGLFTAISRWYDDFSEVTDEDVRRLLQQANRLVPVAA